jgi:hypothetical protein
LGVYAERSDNTVREAGAEGGRHPCAPVDRRVLCRGDGTVIWIDLSGWSPELTRAVLGPLSDRALFGTDHPFISFTKWLDAFRADQPPPEVEERILIGNATRLLGQ